MNTTSYFVYDFYNDILEFFNRAFHNTPVKLNIIEIDKKIVPNPIFSEINDTENLDVFETCLQEVLKSKVQWSGAKENALENLQQLTAIAKQFVGPFIFRTRHNLNEKLDNKFTFK